MVLFRLSVSFDSEQARNVMGSCSHLYCQMLLTFTIICIIHRKCLYFCFFSRVNRPPKSVTCGPVLSTLLSSSTSSSGTPSAPQTLEYLASKSGTTTEASMYLLFIYSFIYLDVSTGYKMLICQVTGFAVWAAHALSPFWDYIAACKTWAHKSSTLVCCHHNAGWLYLRSYITVVALLWLA